MVKMDRDTHMIAACDGLYITREARFYTKTGDAENKRRQT